MRMIAALIFVLASQALSAQGRPAFHGPSGAWYFLPYPTHPANGDRSAKTPEAIAKVNRKLADSGDLEGKFQLGLAFLQGYGTKYDVLQAQSLMEQGAVTTQEKYILGQLFETGEYFPRDLDAASHWYLSTGKSGDAFTAAGLYRRKSLPDIPGAIAIYRRLLEDPDTAEYRRAQMELGNLVLDGKYSAGDDAAGHAANPEWARIITQELLGQQEYTMAVAYSAAVDGVPHDETMWLRFCKRAAAYNMDLAQQFYGRAILDGEIKNKSPFEGYAWIRLASDKQYSNKATVQALEKQMSARQLLEANSVFDGLVQTRARYGAYYPIGDPLREPDAAALKAMPDDDPDVQLRRAFALESSANAEDYQRAITMYRIARDRREMDVKVVLGRDLMYGTGGVVKNSALAKYWLTSALNSGSRPAALLLAKWYRGDGDTTDPVQALAWQLIGYEGSTPVIPDTSLTKAQRFEALKIYKDWISTHTAWKPSPNQLAD